MIDCISYTICEKYPESLVIFVSRRFPQMDDYQQRAGYGKLVSLKLALKTRKINPELFLDLLNETIANHRAGEDETLNAGVESTDETTEGSSAGEKITVTGLLPCPVRIPLLESFTRFTKEYQKAHSVLIQGELKAASTGTSWVEEHIDRANSIDDLPDLFLSAGFDLFFDEKKIGRFRRDGEFTDLISDRWGNPAFDGLDVVDPDREYSIIGVVPAIFLVNTEDLKGRKVPHSWEELLFGDWDNSVSLPVGDFDLFKAILLTLGNRYGEEGLRRLGKIMLDAMLSPIFMLAKQNKAELLKPLAEYFASKDVGEILFHQGLFPSLHPDVDNRLPEGARFLWLGWDYIKEHDLSREISRCEELFHSADRENREVEV